MSLHLELKETLKVALKEKDQVRLRTVRGILTALTNELVATGKTPQDTVDDTTALTVIKRLAKQRKDSIEQYTAANRMDLVAPEQEELVVLESYLPTLMSQAEIRPVVEAKMTELDITDKSKIGILIGAVMKELQGKADGADVKSVAEDVLVS